MNEEKTCCVCGTEIEWEGTHSRKGKIWECECCGNYFCEQCLIDAHGFKAFEDCLCAEGQKTVYCPECYGVYFPSNTMEEIIEDQNEQRAVDELYGVEDR